MITLKNVSIDCFFLPDDSPVAEPQYLNVLKSPGKTYIDDYGLSWVGLVDEIIAADKSGVTFDIACDHTQACGPSVKPILEKLAVAFKASGTGSMITIVSAPTGHIWHYKSLICLALDGGEDWCITGSTNQTEVAYKEGNSLLIFRSTAYAQAMILIHNAIVDLNRKKHQEWQIM